MIAVELFAGGGGAATGLRAAGVRSLACVDHDDAACRVLAAQGFPAVRADVGHLPLRGLRPDLVWASPPCQPFSSAGGRAGADDARDGFPALFRALDELRPAWCVVENVPGLLQHRSAVCPDPARCPGCYWPGLVRQFRARFPHVTWRVLDAAAYGVPQRRRRVYLVAGPVPYAWPDPTHGPPGMGADLFGPALPRWRTVRDALGLPVVGAGTNPHGPGREHERTERDLSDERLHVYDRPSVTVTGSDGSARAVGGRRGPRNPHEALRRRLTPAELALLQAWPEVIPHLSVARTKHLYSLCEHGDDATCPTCEAVVVLDHALSTLRGFARCWLGCGGGYYDRYGYVDVPERARKALEEHP